MQEKLFIQKLFNKILIGISHIEIFILVNLERLMYDILKKNMHSNKYKTMYSKDEIFDDLIKQCKYAIPGKPLSYALRHHIEKCKLKTRKEIVSYLKDGCAPLFIACKRGCVEIVEYLIKVCHADIEQRGKYSVSDTSVHYATPLWCAAVSGKLPVVKCLIAHGADVNAVSDSGSTPVRSTCFVTHMDIVSYLVENGADIMKTNYNGGTCLINSIQSVALCAFLLKHGADVNARDIQNKTALHYAIQENRLNTTKLFLKHNADPHIRSRFNDDALQIACLKGTVPIFKYLVKNVSYSPERLADANELLGSTFFDDSNDAQIALMYWRTAMEIRNAHMVDGKPLPKRPVLPRRDTYRYATEFTTLEELNTIALDLDAMRTQSLLICERILGPHHKNTLFSLMLRGALYIDGFRYQRCIDLWRRALEIRVEKDSILYADTSLIAQSLLRLMVDLNKKALDVMNRDRNKKEPRFCDVVATFKLLSSQLIEARKLLEIRPVHKQQQKSYECILKCVTHLIYLLVETGETNEEKTLTKQLVHELVKQNPRSAQAEDTLLHLCVSSLNTIETSYFIVANEPQVIFPHVKVVKLLLECGAKVNARNESRSTPLYIASKAVIFNSPLINLLLDHGAHLDVPNKTGKTPAHLISSYPGNNVNLLNYISLKCHAAQAMCKYGINCTELPSVLQEFLKFHRV